MENARNLIVCCDGTWNTSEAETVTNVVKIYNALEQSETQLCRYQSGVGTSGGLLTWLAGGASGIGLSRDVMNAYHWLCTNYRAGDRVWLFGFSRGAYTARSVAGMVGSCGLIKIDAADHGWQQIEGLYKDVYRGRRKPPAGVKYSYDPNTPGTVPFPVYFIGVWDTVGSLGVPDNLGLVNLVDSPTAYEFHDVKLNSNVSHARHCLALDEWRGPFTPTLWDEPNSARLKQVWFPGGHVDVGGGYPQTGLSDASLLWMINEARQVKPAALRFNDALVDTLRPDARAPIHDDNRAALAALAAAYVTIEPVLDYIFEPRPRAAPALTEPNLISDTHPTGVVHPIVRERQMRPFLETGAYRPHRVLAPGKSWEGTVYAHKKWNVTGLFLEAGKYKLSALGKWRDLDRWCGPEGASFELRRLPGTLLGAAESAFQLVSKNTSANFLFTRRHEGERWMSLIGVVANGAIQADGLYRKHQTFGIGAGLEELTVDKPGYFYAFANDTPGGYNDNLGSVELQIGRLR